MPLLRFSKSLVMCIGKFLTTRRGTLILNDIVTILRWNIGGALGQSLLYSS